MNKLFEKSSKLRNLRQQVVGVEKIKEDPFANDRLELEDYETVVKTTRGAIENFQRSLSHLNGVHAEMMRSLAKFHEFNEDISQKSRIASMEIAVNSIDENFENSKDNIDLVLHKLDSLIAMHAGLSGRLIERDKAYAAKAHYESKMNTLQAGERDPEKIQRNMKKQQEAQDEFDKTEALTIRECRDALNKRWKDMDQILGLYIRELSKYFGGISDKFTPLQAVTEEMINSNIGKELVTEEVPEGPNDEVKIDEVDVRRSTSQHDIDANAEHNALRNALGLRLKGKGPQIETSTKVVDSDNDSDLLTPPSMKGR
jgi:hypothetical protein